MGDRTEKQIDTVEAQQRHNTTEKQIDKTRDTKRHKETQRDKKS